MKPPVLPSLIILAAMLGLGLQAQQPPVTAKQTQATPATVRAFPTAEGFGAETRGAYGNPKVTPKVYKVTTLEDPATRAATFDGSFRWAVEAPEPRVIAFAVSGYIVIKRPLVIKAPYVTIAAQTAPGDGICLRNDPDYGGKTLLIATHDVIVRHLRVRPGRCNPGVKVSSQTAIHVGDDKKSPVFRVILDHCSATWGIDGCMQTYGTAQDVTIQWCIISEGLDKAGHEKGTHSIALNFAVGYGEENYGRFSVHHNLMSHVGFRVPQISTKLGKVEVINNVVYHTTKRGMNINAAGNNILGASKHRIVKNHLLRTADKHGDLSISPTHLPEVLVHARGNLGPGRGDDSLADNLSLGTAPTESCPCCNATKPASLRNHWTKDPLCAAAKGGDFPYAKIRVTEDDNAKITLARISGTGDFAKKLNVGATKPTRDTVDARILQQLTNYLANPKDPKTVPVPGGPRGGLLDDPAQVGGYPKLATGAPPADADGDGIPDAWEIANKLDPMPIRRPPMGTRTSKTT